MNPREPSKTRRSLRALLVLGVYLALTASIGGGLILALNYPRPDVTQPLWKFAPYVMLLGLTNFLV
jgi:hypothetical protein